FHVKPIPPPPVPHIPPIPKLQPATTITHQYPPNLYLHHHKTSNPKSNQPFYTIPLQQNYTKHDILQPYFNTI
ncbi:transglycosylase domain-containing protein, partial [Bacillus pumilus]|uniref:transglycosylase domain-containing protein n=1 Tax=Bacillus pumilus TaxID=1408 RepID=UPI0016434C9A